MKVGPSTTKELRITHWDEKGILLIDMDWDDWDELVKDAEYFRKHGQVRGGALRASPLDLPAQARSDIPLTGDPS